MNSISLGKGTFPFVFAPMNLGWKHQKSYLLRRTTFDSFKFNFGFKCISKLYDCFLTRGLGARKAKTFLQTPATYEVAVSHHARSPWKKRAEFETYVFMMSSLRHLGSSNSSSFSSSPSLSTMNRFFLVWYNVPAKLRSSVYPWMTTSRPTRKKPLYSSYEEMNSTSNTRSGKQPWLVIIVDLKEISFNLLSS